MKQPVGRDISVGIETRYGPDGPRIESRWGARFPAPVQTGHGAHPVSYTMDNGSSPGVKRPGRGVDHPPHLAPRLMKRWSYTSTPHLDLRGMFQGEIYLYLYLNWSQENNNIFKNIIWVV